MGSKLLFNDDWEFEKVTPEGKKSGWSRVDIPHDWQIYDCDNLYEDGEGWYRKQFTYKVTDERAFIRFDGVYMDTTVWVNDSFAGEWKYGYSTFEYEITEFLKDGENEIKVRTILKHPNSRWYSGAGIYRNVWFITKPPVCLVSDGIYVTAKKNDNSWLVEVDAEVDCSKVQNGDIYSVSFEIIDPDGDRIDTAKVEIDKNNKAYCSFEVVNPKVWDIIHPYLHIMNVKLLKNDVIVENESIRFGFRTIEYYTDRGFFLNGRHVKLQGVCMHHDLGCLGAAINTAALKRQIRILKQMGVNAIRTAHNMAAPELLNLADEEGILINAESFDMWEGRKTEYDYARFFKEWHERDVESWVRRDRNHPSIIMWCIGNEIYDTHAGERGQEITRDLMKLVYKYDYRHVAPVTIGSNYMPWENAQKCADIVKLAGYNYAESYYDEHHNEHKDWIIYGSETSSVVQSRGIYHFPATTEILDDDDLQCSSLGNSTTSWGARSIEKCITDDRDAKFSAGMFIWSGFDYIGEPTPYHTKNSYFGQIDTAGFPKDTFYIYKAAWTDYKKEPMVHICPYWDWCAGQLIDILVTTNAPKVELFFNGKSMGVREIDVKNDKEIVARWQKAYEKGELKAVAYDEFGNEIAVDVQKSFGDAKNIVLTPDKEIMAADGEDLIFVEISASDAEGNTVHNATNRMDISVTGAGRLIGIDNGDSTDRDSYKGTSKRLFSGKLLAVIAAKTESGDINVTVTSEGLRESKLTLKAVPAAIREGISAIEENVVSEVNNEVPVRKIEIISNIDSFDEKCTEADFTVKIYPENATYKDVAFRVTDDNGNNSGIAKITYEGNRAHVKVIGDGCFRLRCTSNSGTDHAEIIAQKEFEVTGIGTAYKNPYDFIAGSLYDNSMGTLTNGNERGVATPRDHTSYILYDDIDFGDWGSDEITIPIFELESSELEFEIWEGMPYGDGSKKLLDAVYDKPSRWNTYQEETFKLNRRIKGVTSLGFVFFRKAHIKGFSFTRQEKAYEKLLITESNSVYGDTFTVKEDAIEGIGNNVSFVYENMNFGENGLSGITICGRTPLENNTIHIRFRQNGENINQIIEFPHSEEYTEQSYSLEQIAGICDEVLFVFMPGSNFDFRWFKFH